MIRDINQLVEQVKAIKTKSDSNKVWIYVAVGVLGHLIARHTGQCVPLRDQVNRHLVVINELHARARVHWFYEKETLIVTFR